MLATQLDLSTFSFASKGVHTRCRSYGPWMCGSSSTRAQYRFEDHPVTHSKKADHRDEDLLDLANAALGHSGNPTSVVPKLGSIPARPVLAAVKGNFISWSRSTSKWQWSMCDPPAPAQPWMWRSVAVSSSWRPSTVDLSPCRSDSGSVAGGSSGDLNLPITAIYSSFGQAL